MEPFARFFRPEIYYQFKGSDLLVRWTNYKGDRERRQGLIDT